ncbi:MAG: Fe(3+) ABC transporter substrate-binding protein [Bosea sp. (in: a-proteobacteria)]
MFKLSVSGYVASILALACGLPALANAQGEVNVYTYREPPLIAPLFDAFTKDTGVKVNVIFAKDGLEQRIAVEGQASPADMLLTVDIGRMQEAVDRGISQPIKSKALDETVPAGFRDPDGRWYAISARARVLYVGKDKFKGEAITYEDLADPKFKGKICIRSGQNIYNIGLFAAVVARMGEARAEEWLKGLKANLAQKPSGGDREQARDVAAGKCEIGIGNTYYWGLMANREAERKAWAEATRVMLPTFRDGGTHMNISGFVVAKHAPNRDNAIKLGEWLVSEKAQQLYAATNFEYPVRAGVQLDEVVASFGKLTPDKTPLSDIAKSRKAASILVDKVGFDN